MTSVARINVNGQQVAFKQGESKDANKLNREMSRWVCEMEFVVRATLQAAGADTATIRIITDNRIIEHEWFATDDSCYGNMKAGTIIA